MPDLPEIRSVRAQLWFDKLVLARHYYRDTTSVVEVGMIELMKRLWSEEQGQDIAEYAVMLAVILVLVVGTVRLIGGHSNNVFSTVASSIGQ